MYCEKESVGQPTGAIGEIDGTHLDDGIRAEFRPHQLSPITTAPNQIGSWTEWRNIALKLRVRRVVATTASTTVDSFIESPLKNACNRCGQ